MIEFAAWLSSTSKWRNGMAWHAIELQRLLKSVVHALYYRLWALNLPLSPKYPLHERMHPIPLPTTTTQDVEAMMARRARSSPWLHTLHRITSLLFLHECLTHAKGNLAFVSLPLIEDSLG